MSQHLSLSLSGVDYQIAYHPGLTLREILMDASVNIRTACGGVGACGQCRVRIETGEVNSPSPSERNKLGENLISQGWRLACQTRPAADVRIALSDSIPRLNWRALHENEYFQPTGYFKKIAVQSDADVYGVAVDLGTTCIRVSLIDLGSARHVAGRSGLNPQFSLGADVLTRLTAALSSSVQAEALRRQVVQAIAEALHDISFVEIIPLELIVKVVISGNTAMLGLLAGKNTNLLHPDNWMREIDCSPDDTSGWSESWGLQAGTPVIVAPPLAGFVGSDLLAGILATDVIAGPPGTLLIDFGTNSEMALWDGRVMWCTSSAGGPAFEGCGISCGMPAEPGAIYHVEMDPNGANFNFEVLGGVQPIGLCGSGFVDLVAGMIRAGILKANGRFARQQEKNQIIISNLPEPLSLNSQDIDAFQRAKAAISAGVLCLLEKSGLCLADLEHLYICGAFGRHLNVQHAQEVGLLPGLPLRKIDLCGNTALAGCELMLLAPDGTALLNAIREKSQIINLSMFSRFEELFIENLYLKPM